MWDLTCLCSHLKIIIIIIINWAVYNRWFLSNGLFWKEKTSHPFPLGVFGLCWRAREGREPVLFLLGLSRRGGQQLHSLDPRPPPPWRGRRGQAPKLAGPRPSGAALWPGWHALCSQDCFLSPGPRLTRAPAPSSAPAPVFPVRILPAGWWLGAEWGRPPPTGWLWPGTWKPWPLRPPPPHRPCRVCGQRRAGVGFSFFFFFSWFFLLFQRWDIDQNCSVYAWNWMERLWNSCGGRGGTPTTKQMCCFWTCFYFQKPTNATVEPVPSQEEWLMASLTSPPCIETSVSCPETPEFFVHLHPSPPSPL